MKEKLKEKHLYYWMISGLLLDSKLLKIQKRLTKHLNTFQKEAFEADLSKTNIFPEKNIVPGNKIKKNGTYSKNLKFGAITKKHVPKKPTKIDLIRML